MEIPSWEIFSHRFRLPLLIGLLGAVLVGVGFLFFILDRPQEDKIEIISSTESQIEQEAIFGDIEGAVQKPGVYELSFGARVEDLLIAAGGLSAEADREWVEKTLNRAQKLTDGVKIYIPKKGEEVKGVTRSVSSGQAVVEEQSNLVNINTASQSELEALWGIGPATAQKIITNRPYQSVEELLTKKILKSNVYQRISNQLTVY